MTLLLLVVAVVNPFVVWMVWGDAIVAWYRRPAAVAREQRIREYGRVNGWTSPEWFDALPRTARVGIVALCVPPCAFLLIGYVLVLA